MIWEVSWRCDPTVRPLADRHYNRRSVGASNFVPTGKCLVLRAPGAFWCTSWPLTEFVKSEWRGCWVCSAYRRESGYVKASDQITEALAATRWKWPKVPRVSLQAIIRKPDRSCLVKIDICMITFVDESYTKHKRDPGRCFRKVGFVDLGRSKKGLVLLGLPADSLPPPQPPRNSQMSLFVP